MKSKLIKAFAFLLSMIMIATTLFSCATPLPPNNNPNQNQSDLEVPTETQGDDSSETENDKKAETDNKDTSDKNNTEDTQPDGTITVYANNTYKANVVGIANAKDYNKSISNYVRNLFGTLSGFYPTVQTDESISNGPAILIGETNYPESKEVYKNLQENQAKATVVNDKYVIAYSSEFAAIQLFEQLKVLFNKYATKEKIVIDSKWDIDLTAIDKTAPVLSGKNMVMAGDQINGRIVIYDFNKYTTTKSLDQMEVKSFNLGHTSDVKYREGTVFGDVLLITGDRASGNTGIYNYSTGKSIWKTSNCGSNPHSIEILPSGNIVIASSTDGKLRLCKTSALQTNDTATANTYIDYSLEDAHGVLWDPTYKVVWALGRYELRAYAISGTGTGEKLVEVTNMRIYLPEGHRGGHDLSPDYTNTRYLYITVGEFALKIDKQELKIIADYEYSKLMNARNIKGFSNNPLGNFFITGEIGTTSYSTSTTNSIYFCRYNGTTYEKIKLTSSKAAIYKARAFCGTYQ